MNMMDELTEKFALELDVPLGSCKEYNEISKEIHEFAKRELSKSKGEMHQPLHEEKQRYNKMRNLRI